MRLGVGGAELRHAASQRGGEVAHRREAPRGILLECALHRRRETQRDVRPALRDVRHGFVAVLDRHGDEVVAGEGHVACEQLVEHDAERIDVGRRRHRLARRLLRREVVARAEHRPGLRDAVLDVERAGDAEVGDLGLAVSVQQNVLRLHVAVHDPVLVREAESLGDRERELDRASDRERPGALDELLEVLTVDELEDDELVPVGLAAVDHRDDVRMGELRDRPRLTPEALDVLRVVAEAGMQHLQCDVPLEQLVVRLVDARHAAGAHDLEHLVAVGDHVTDHLFVSSCRRGRLKGARHSGPTRDRP